MFTFGFVQTLPNREDIFQSSYQIWTERREVLQRIVENPEIQDTSIPSFLRFFSSVYGEKNSQCLFDILKKESDLIRQLSTIEQKKIIPLVDRGRENAKNMAKLFADFNPYFTTGIGDLLFARFFDMFVEQSRGNQGAKKEQFRLSFQIARTMSDGMCEQLSL